MVFNNLSAEFKWFIQIFSFNEFHKKNGQNHNFKNFLGATLFSYSKKTHNNPKPEYIVLKDQNFLRDLFFFFNYVLNRKFSSYY